MKRPLLFFLFILCATWGYAVDYTQYIIPNETAFIANGTSAWINTTLAYDADWDTYALWTGSDGEGGIYYFNYTPETYTTDSGFFEYRLVFIPGAHYNISMVSSCLLYGDEKIEFKFEVYNQTGNSSYMYSYYCYDGAWQILSATGRTYPGLDYLPARVFETTLHFQERYTPHNIMFNNSVIIRADGINSQLTTDKTLQLDALTVDDTYFYMDHYNYSTVTPYSDEIVNQSVNVSSSNRFYTVASLPVLNASTLSRKTFTSLVYDPGDSYNQFNMTYCNISNVYYYSANTTYDKTYTSSEWNCTDNILNINITGIERGTNYLLIEYNYSLFNCSSGNIVLNMTVFNENAPTSSLTASMELFAEYWVQENNKKNLSYNYEGDSSYYLCLTANDNTIYSDIYMKYTTDNGFTHRHYLVNQSLLNTTQNISMYNFNTTSGISDLSITARIIQSYGYFSNVIAKLQRYYVSENLWRTVQMDESGDFGLLHFNIYEEDTDYRLIYINWSNNVFKTTDKLKFVCSSGVCEITQLLDPTVATVTTDDVEFTWAYNNNSQLITFTWNNVLGETSTIDIKVRKNTITGEAMICNIQQTGASGTYECNATGYSGEVFVTLKTGGDYLISDWLQLTKGALSTIIGDNEGAWWSFVIALVVVGAGLFHPVAALAALVMALFIINKLGIYDPITTPFIIIVGVIAAAISVKIKQ